MDVPHTDLLQLLLQREVGSTHNVGDVDPAFHDARKHVNAELTTAHVFVPMTIKGVLELTLQALLPQDDVKAQ